MSQPKQPSSDKTKSNTAKDELTRRDLDQVSGGKVQLSDITITKQVDKSSPSLGH